MNLRALHIGGGITTRYSSIYAQLFMIWLMTTTGLRWTGISCAFSFTVVCGLCDFYMNNDLFQRYESVLENLQQDDDWRAMCATTPLSVRGGRFKGPSSCANWVRWQVFQLLKSFFFHITYLILWFLSGKWHKWDMANEGRKLRRAILYGANESKYGAAWVRNLPLEFALISSLSPESEYLFQQL